MDKGVQTSTEHIIIQNVSIQTTPNPPLTLQQKEPPNLPNSLTTKRSPERSKTLHTSDSSLRGTQPHLKPLQIIPSDHKP